MSTTATQQDLELLLTGCLTQARVDAYDASKGYTDTKIAEVKTLIGAAGDVDLSGITSLIDSIMNAADGDTTAAGFQILEGLRSDVNAAIAAGATNASALNTLQSSVATGLSSLQSALEANKTENAEKIAELRGLISQNETALQAEVVRATGVDASQQADIDTLKAQIVALQTKDTEAEACCAAVKARLDALEASVAQLAAAQTSTAATLEAEAAARLEADEKLRDRLTSVENRVDDTGIDTVFNAMEAACSAGRSAFLAYVANSGSTPTVADPLPEASGSDSGAASSI